MTRAGKLFPVLCTVLSIEASTHVVDPDYRSDSRATNLKSVGQMAVGQAFAIEITKGARFCPRNRHARLVRTLLLPSAFKPDVPISGIRLSGWVHREARDGATRGNR
jgi:hypothetical protein